MAGKMEKVSAVIITLNEEKKIERCLDSLTWADEIVVIDALSKDQTKAICQNPSKPWAGKLRFMERPWTGFKDQRNFAIQQAANNWVLAVDADEQCTPELAQKVREILSRSGGPELRAYKVRREEYFIGTIIRHGMWNPSYQDRFFHRQGVKYVNDVHEYPVFPQPPGRIDEPLIHNPDFSVEQYMDKLNKYTSIEAKDRYMQGKRTNWFHLIFTFPAMSLKSYFYYGAYKDGMYGVIISLLEGISRLTRHIKLWQLMELEKKKGKPIS